MAADTEQREILAELRELKAEFAAVHKRLDKLDSIDKATKRTERKTDRGFAAIGETLAWQDLIQNLILYGVCLASVSVVTSIGVIRSEVCPKAPGWALHLIPFGNVICAGTAEKPAVNADPIVALRRAIIGQESNGNHTAMNASGSGATGLGQVMPENIAAWSQQCIGRSLSQDEFKNDPDTQTKIIDCKLKEYWEQVEGDDEARVRKVAAMWYSGRSDLYDSDAPQSWAGNSYPSIRDYTLKVLDRWKEVQTQQPIESAGKITLFKGIQVTSARDSSGEPGLDYVVSGGQRGAEFGALAAGTVVEVVADQNWESHLEAGDFRRGYGNLVVVRVKDEVSDEEVDMLYAHMDAVLVQKGQQVEVGTAIGTQGRKGSTTGPHVSVDFFIPGTRTASTTSLAMRDRIAGILASNPDSLKQQIQTAQPPAPDPQGKPQWALSKIQLPSLQHFAPDPQATINGIPSSFVSVQISVVNLETGKTELKNCSGFAVAPDRIATAKHCVKNPVNVVVIDQQGNWLAGQQLASAEDTAIVSVPGANFTPAVLGDVPAPGDVVTSWGHPHGAATIEAAQIKINAINGSIFAAAPAGNRHVVAGYSGGPVFDADGRVIGFNSEANPVGMVKVQSIEVVKELLQ